MIPRCGLFISVSPTLLARREKPLCYSDRLPLSRSYRFMASERDAWKAGVNGGRSANSASGDLPWR
jgi:hypothetical protein